LRLLCTQLNNNWQESVKEFKTQNDWAEMIFFCRLTATICSKQKKNENATRKGKVKRHHRPKLIGNNN